MAAKQSRKPVKSSPPQPVRTPPPAQEEVPPVASRTSVHGAVEVTSDSYIAKLSPEARARLEAQDKLMKAVNKFVEEHPEVASQLLRSWLTKGK